MLADVLVFGGWAAVLFGVPIVAIAVVARSRGRPVAFAALGLLSWLGVIIALLVMVWTSGGEDEA